MAGLVKICFFGASTTEGLGDMDRLGWPGRLMRRCAYNRPDIVAYNLGLRGQTSAMMKARFMAECSARLGPESNNLVFLSLGLNDLAEVGGLVRMPRHKTLAHVGAMLAQAQGLTNNLLWMGAAPIHPDMMPVTYATGKQFHFRNENIEALNADYARLAVRYQIPFLDVFPPLLEDRAYRHSLAQGDGLHPDGAGYERVVDLIAHWPAWQKISQADFALALAPD